MLIMKASQTSALEAAPLINSLASSILKASVSVPAILPDSIFQMMLLGVLCQS